MAKKTNSLIVLNHLGESVTRVTYLRVSLSLTTLLSLKKKNKHMSRRADLDGEIEPNGESTSANFIEPSMGKAIERGVICQNHKGRMVKGY